MLVVMPSQFLCFGVLVVEDEGAAAGWGIARIGGDRGKVMRGVGGGHTIWTVSNECAPSSGCSFGKTNLYLYLPYSKFAGVRVNLTF